MTRHSEHPTPERANAAGLPAGRRAFLRGLTMLPLIGGGVSLIGTPTAAAEPVTDALLDAYSHWLFYERRLLCLERWPNERRAERVLTPDAGAGDFHFPSDTDWQGLPQPSARAALVLSAVGCGWAKEPAGRPRRQFVF